LKSRKSYVYLGKKEMFLWSIYDFQESFFCCQLRKPMKCVDH